MPSVEIPLSIGSVKALTKNLKAFAAELRDDVRVDIERGVAMGVAEDIRSGIASIKDLDGNYLGGDNPNASVVVEVALDGHEAIWRGKQIAYLEFGTGALGAAGAYPGVAMPMAGYHPDPTKDKWRYKDEKTGRFKMSHGLLPQAPVYNAALAMRLSGQALVPARIVLKEAVARAVSL